MPFGDVALFSVSTVLSGEDVELWRIATVAYCRVLLYAAGCKSNPTRYTVYRENPLIVCSYSPTCFGPCLPFSRGLSELQREV